MKIVFFGTPQFSAEVLRYLLQHNVKVAAVITKPDRPVGRSGTPIPTPVKVEAQAHIHPLPVFQPEIVSAPEFSDTLDSFQADLFVVVAYGEILKQHILDMPKVACINLHTSLLPKYRGAAPIQRCLINGEAETGVTVMHMAKKMDAGDIIKVEKIAIGSNMTYEELEKSLCHIGSKLLLDTIHDFELGIAERYPQDHSQASIAPKIELEDCQIRWNSAAANIHNLVRGVTPHPGAWCYVEVKGQKKRLKIITTRVDAGAVGRPGQIISAGQEGLIIGCEVGAIRILELQLEGKKAMTAKEFLQGIPSNSILFLPD